MANEKYNFKYLPLVGKLPGKSMVEQTETAINELASVVYDNVGHVGNLAEEVKTANTNASNALDKAAEALETSSRVYIKQIAAVDVNDYYDSELYYINNDGSTNIPVRDSGFLAVKTNDDKTACEQVFIADSTGTPYYRHGRITEQTLSEETTYVVTWSDWSSPPASQAYVQGELTNYLPLSGGNITGDLFVTGATSVPTANAGNSSKAIANTEFVAKSIAALVNGAPDQLNTLNELAKALGNDANFSATITAELAKKLNSTEAENTYVKQGGVNLWNALHSRDSATLKGLTNNQWNALGLFLRYFDTTGNFENQPTQYGQLLNIPADKGSGSTQLWIEQPSGKIYARGGNGSKAVKDEVFKQMAFFNSDGHLTFPNGAEMWVY